MTEPGPSASAPGDPTAPARTPKEFSITVLGRTLEHLGVQMYKRRDAAIAELVANAWDAGATSVDIHIPTGGYDPATSEIVVTDDGEGMDDTQVQHDYLVVGRNRRSDGQPQPTARKVMGRKGIGKLAGFGVARIMKVTTWRDGVSTDVELDVVKLKTGTGQTATIPIPGSVGSASPDVSTPTGTRIVLRGLKHKTALDPTALRENLARRFSGTVRGHMKIRVNGVEVAEPNLTFTHREPAQGTITEDVGTGDDVTWWAGFSDTVLRSDMQGFTVLVRGKTAQAPPYFFGVESTASGQHGTKYLTGVIEADFLDDGDDDESDLISTDRQEIDWDDPRTKALKDWGEDLARRLLREHRDRNAKKAEDKVEQDPSLKGRIDALDKPSRDQVRKFIRALGAAETSPERLSELADTIVRAFEYRQFHDYIEDLDRLADNPEQFQTAVEHIRGWKVLESRAILEVIRGRLDIVDKFHTLIVNDAAETAGHVGADNMHDLIADYPWLIDPEWQVLAEEKRITKQLIEWGDTEIPADDRTRYDFLALRGDGGYVVIEIKRAGHPVSIEDLQQLERYVTKLSDGQRRVTGVFITAERYAIPDRQLENWKAREDIDLLTWAQIQERTRLYYEHYRAILSGDRDDDDFDRKSREVARTRQVLEAGAYRGSELRRAGLGPQDVDYTSTAGAEPAPTARALEEHPGGASPTEQLAEPSTAPDPQPGAPRTDEAT